MFLRILSTALFAGAGAGLVAALLQFLFLQPVLIEAERYEAGEVVHFGADGGHDHSTHDHGDEGEAAHDHGSHDDAAPILPRDAMNVIFSIGVYIGYALLLVAGMAAAGSTSGVRSGIVWGIAGFVAVHMAPAFSLAPEVPGAVASDITARQIWWFATAAATAAALWLIAFGRSPGMAAVAAILLLAPHLIGAPEANGYAGTSPPELASLFAARALGIGLAAWAALGALAGFFWQGAESKAA